MSDMKVVFITDTEVKVVMSLPITTTASELLDLQRQYGEAGWTANTIPPHGFIFPFDNERDFDWRIIGGRPFTGRDGTRRVIYRGKTYKRRDFSQDTIKGKAIKYSRGATDDDPEEIVEPASGNGRGYVTLIRFKGGVRNESYAR